MKSDLILSNPERTHENLKRLQALPLEQKINLTKRRIEQYYIHTGGKIYVSFSGGKDSTVLLNIVRSLYPDTPGVFADTGLEFPEIRDFIKTIPNVTWLKPKKTFIRVLKENGYPVVSKEISRGIRDLQNPTALNERTCRIRREGSAFKGGKANTGKISDKWQFLADAPFKCSDSCCGIMKKAPFRKYEKESGNHPIIGTMAYESSLRVQSYISRGCNVFEGHIQSRPLSVWLEDDVWEYIKKYNLPYSNIYNLGYERTGCIFCMFGYWAERKRGLDRFQQLEKTHPQLYKYCMSNLGMRDVIDWIDNQLVNGQKDLFD